MCVPKLAELTKHPVLDQTWQLVVHEQVRNAGQQQQVEHRTRQQLGRGASPVEELPLGCLRLREDGIL